MLIPVLDTSCVRWWHARLPVGRQPRKDDQENLAISEMEHEKWQDEEVFAPIVT